jgi:hypothetical protein
MDMKALCALTLLVVCVASAGCGTSESPVLLEGPGSSEDQKEEAVRHNCRVLKLALEAFAADNGGNYPVSIYEASAEAGKTTIDYLPRGEAFINPFTMLPSEPVDRRASKPGEIGYEEYAWWESCPAYEISGYGRDSIVVVISKLEEFRAVVAANCHLVRQAVELFAAQNGGVYPDDVGTDTTPCGDTIVGLLPGGVSLVNPFTKCASEPVDGTACQPGETGYYPIYVHAINLGYVINGVGHESCVQIVELTNIGSSQDRSVFYNCFCLKYVIHEFAGLNDGIFPRDLSTDTNRHGDTALDMLQAHWLIYSGNPYDETQDLPVDRRASYPGETGYEAVFDGADVADFVITGVGAVADSIIVGYSDDVSCF